MGNQIDRLAWLGESQSNHEEELNIARFRRWRAERRLASTSLGKRLSDGDWFGLYAVAGAFLLVLLVLLTRGWGG